MFPLKGMSNSGKKKKKFTQGTQELSVVYKLQRSVSLNHPRGMKGTIIHTCVNHLLLAQLSEYKTATRNIKVGAQEVYAVHTCGPRRLTGRLQSQPDMK